MKKIEIMLYKIIALVPTNYNFNYIIGEMKVLFKKNQVLPWVL